MKKTIFISSLALVFMLLAGVSKAQDSKILLGGGLGYATDISTAGLFVKGNYAINEKFEAAGQFTYFFPKDQGEFDLKYHWMALDLDGHYIFFKQDKISAYGLAGLNIFMIKIPDYETSFMGQPIKIEGTSKSKAGLNIGAGGRFALSDKLSALGEVKYVVGDASYLQLSVGILFAL